ncbi:hypothetical protein CAPTEDRAFT_135035 [Capitella teleta]|uniref:Bifunctional riboflavin kinase/FMN adenylyltransferase n=1 Tax=Capitella teleta TaxID=283909 RepID=R7U1B3_CAPTE|nr:hypothetical protein CAPTEDRAFT_135035 [Capitella teleta]|eukprot:ELU00004.1 hypothetical protein CAPTEDRAFT_135035 [Capitella teleta]
MEITCFTRPNQASPHRAGQGRALTIGNFDGVHLGHVHLIKKLVAEAKRSGLTAAALTFEPHPARHFAPERPFFQLTPSARKIELMLNEGIDEVHLARFDTAFAAMSAETFSTKILKGQLDTKALIVGPDFRFGAGRKGDVDLLKASGFHCSPPPLYQDKASGENISSSLIRKALASGDPAYATRLMGRPFRVEGKVVHGAARGRELGMPTANQLLDSGCDLKNGVYAVFAEVDGKRYPAATNWGRRPQFGQDSDLILETHLLDWSGDLYGQNIAIDFIAYLRPEAKFESVEALRLAMEADCLQARDLLRAFFKKTSS